MVSLKTGASLHNRTMCNGHKHFVLVVFLHACTIAAFCYLFKGTISQDWIGPKVVWLTVPKYGQ
jgi:hypothetical protein